MTFIVQYNTIILYQFLMMISRLRFASIIALTLFLLSCNNSNDGMVRGNKAVSSILDSVEYIMDDDSHYADSLVRLIDPQSIKGKKLRARYALLYTATQYKEYQPFTSDSLIMEAVHYYSLSNNINYRFLSYYNQGCVYLEMGKITEASVAFAQAELLVDKIDNDHWKGLLYYHMGSILKESYYFNRANDYFHKASLFYEKADSKSHRIHALLMEADCESDMRHYEIADSIYMLIQQSAIINNYESHFNKSVYFRFVNYVLTNNIDSATVLLERYQSIIDSPNLFYFSPTVLAMYYNLKDDYYRSESYLNMGKNYIKTIGDSIYWFYCNYVMEEHKGNVQKALDYQNQSTSLQYDKFRNKLYVSVLGAQKDYLYKEVELEAVKKKNRKIIIVSAIVILTLTLTTLIIISLKRKRESESEKRDYLCAINDLTTMISVNQDKISKLNDKVREMLRQQFNPSDYLYTRYYEQIDDNKKAERLYRVVRNQVEDFTNRKNVEYIDNLLNETFDGIMSKVQSSGIDIKEKDLLLLRFVLAGFSSKSIAALLGETHLNVNQRKKRLLDKIQIKDPKLMSELSNALNNK